MAEPGDKLARAYRDLAREEPPPALDRAILAASSRALRRPSAARRWGVPVSIAAMLVLAIGVTLEMQHEQPGVETSAPGAGSIPPRAVEPAPPPLPQAQAPVTPPSPAIVPAPAMRQKREAAAPPNPKVIEREEAPAPAAPPAAAPEPQAFPLQERRMAPAPMPAPERSSAERSNLESSKADMQFAPAAPAGAAASAPAPTMKSLRAQSEEERELERIATLRTQGRHAEADKALDEFRRAHPDYRIPDATWERVKPR